MKTRKEIIQIFVNEAVFNGRVSVSYYWTESVTAILETMGYTVVRLPMTYTRIMGNLIPDRNFDILKIREV